MASRKRKILIPTDQDQLAVDSGILDGIKWSYAFYKLEEALENDDDEGDGIDLSTKKGQWDFVLDQIQFLNTDEACAISAFRKTKTEPGTTAKRKKR